MLMKIINDLIAATRYSIAGLCFAFQEELAFRLEIAASVVILPLALLLGKSNLERAILIFVWMIVLVVELLNSAIENTVNRISEERHPLSQRAKDMGSAAVFVAIINCVLVWSLIVL